MTRLFYVRTFGCQMNEHDSSGSPRTSTAGSRTYRPIPNVLTLLVLNTCCMGKNADTKLYGHLGHLSR